MIAKEDAYIDKAYEQLVKLSADDKKRLEYEAREKARLDHNSMMEYNQREGMKQGIEQGTARYSKLIKILAGENKLDLLVDAADNSELLYRLYEEYGL